eukprot:TRINITY_DN29973_c0_g1_i2.p1 TRINITY_DN29973_c0_g1~~TRINITY_DN29973_c0_g1_i2.p1  ORF type:complete len:111 (+),score=15.21 TRINITY_DN29973_c0_g1_i2:154-486(+)
MTGFAGWFDADFGGNVTLETGPSDRSLTHWGQVVLPCVSNGPWQEKENLRGTIAFERYGQRGYKVEASWSSYSAKWHLGGAYHLDSGVSVYRTVGKLRAKELESMWSAGS